MDIDHLSKLPVDLFIQQITYLPFEDVISVCKANTKLHRYCSEFNIQWKALINNTFGNVYGYQDKLKVIWSKLGVKENIYNYSIYTQLVKLLDPITQLMIYYRQGDMKSFDDPKFKQNQRFLALFLLGDKDKMEDYLPSESYRPFISILNGAKISQYTLNNMSIEMSQEGSVKGVIMMLDKGADIRDQDDRALRRASQEGHLEVVKYLAGLGANIHAQDDKAMRWASENGHLAVVKYLVEHGANIHAVGDSALRSASINGRLDVVKYLTEKGADIHAVDDWALIEASHNGHLEVVKYLVEQGANIHANNDEALRLASQSGHLEVVKYLTEHGANIHADNDEALKFASVNGHLEVVKYLESVVDNKNNLNNASRWDNKIE